MVKVGHFLGKKYTIAIFAKIKRLNESFDTLVCFDLLV
jgi:hypothetical protein